MPGMQPSTSPAGLETLGQDRVSWSGSRARPTVSVALDADDTVDYFPLTTTGVDVRWRVAGGSEGQEARRFEAMYEIAEPSADPAPVLGVLKIEREGTARYYEVAHGFDE